MKIKVIYDHLKQDGGSAYYLPCEITHFTKDVYYSDTYRGKLKQYIGLYADKIDYDYCQDIYIQLYNGEKYYNITTNNHKRPFIELNYNMKELYCKDPECLCNHKRLPEQKFKNGDKVEFKNAGWNCIPKLKYNNNNNSFMKDELIEITGLNSNGFSDKDNIIHEQTKGGNYISAPNNTIFYIDGTDIIIKKIQEINPHLNCIQLKCSFKAQNVFRHIDELMCFMPYGIGKYKVWFYNELTKMHFNNKYTDDVILNINKERLHNLELISEALFGSSFADCSDNFVFFDFYIWTQSILNRTWYETSEKCICLFPILEPDSQSEIKKDLIQKLYNRLYAEMRNVYSYINNNEPCYEFIQVSAVNVEKPNGTLHCLIKQRFI
jgi:hypothetical protein